MKTVTDLYIDSSKYCIEEAITFINKFVTTNDENNLQIDISKFNFLEAMNICIMSSTFSFTKNPDNKIKWIVNSQDTKKIINRLKLKNISLEVKVSDNLLNLPTAV